MAVGKFLLYKANLDNLTLNQLSTATVKVALIASTYTPNLATNGHSVWADVSAYEIATTGQTAYTTGGYTLTADAVASTTDGWKYSSENVAWTADGTGIPAWKYAVFRITSGTVADEPATALIGYFAGDDTTTVPLTSAGNTLTLNCPAGGWFDCTTAST